MPQSQTKTSEGQDIDKTSSHRENADKAIEAFQDLVVHLNDRQAQDAYTSLVVGRGFSKSQPLYCDKAIPGSTKPLTGTEERKNRDIRPQEDAEAPRIREKLI
jgi:hypothetical protein